MAHQHLTFRPEGGSAQPKSHKWVFAECYWDDAVGTVGARGFSRWLGFSLPPLVLWQAGASFLSGARRRLRSRQAWNPVSWYGFLCSSYWNVTLRPLVAYVLMILMAPVGFLPLKEEELRRGGKKRFLPVLLTIADTYAFAADPSIAVQIKGRFAAAYSAMQDDCRHVIVVGHSQGGAIAHAVLSEGARPPAAFVGLGSGMGPLGSARVISRARSSAPRVLLSMLLGMAACTAAAIALFYILVVATVIMLFGVLVLLACLLFLTSLGNGVSAAWGSVYSSTGGLRHQEFWAAAGARAWESGVHALVMGAVASVFILASMRFTFGRRSVRRAVAADLGLEKGRWLEFYSPLDPVSVGTAANRHVVPRRVHNPTGWRLWREHGAYLAPGSAVLPEIGALIASVDRLPAFVPAHARPRVWQWARAAILWAIPVAGWLIVMQSSRPA